MNTSKNKVNKISYATLALSVTDSKYFLSSIPANFSRMKGEFEVFWD